MPFFTAPKKRGQSDLKGLDPAFVHRMECRACPLNNLERINPHVEPHGAENARIYILGSRLTKKDDASGYSFSGAAGKMLKAQIPEYWKDRVRFNTVIRTLTPDDPKTERPRKAAPVELEACRPSIERDILATLPEAIFGIGDGALKWATRMSYIQNWNGRRIPIEVAGHRCWFFPMLDPTEILAENRYKAGSVPGGYGSESEFAFALDMAAAFAAVREGLPEPIIHTRDMATADVDYVTGHKPGDLEKVLRWIKETYSEPETGFDYETAGTPTGLRPYVKDARILTIGMDTQSRTFAFPLYHRQAGWKPDEVAQIEDAMEDWFYNSPTRKIAHQLSFEHEWTAYFYGKKAIRASRWDDTQSQAYVRDERQGKGRPDCLSLAFLTVQYYGINIKELSAVDRKDLDEVDIHEVLPYNAIDARYTRFLDRDQMALLEAEGRMEVYEHHIRRIPTMVLTQIKGVPVSARRNDELFDRYTAEAAEYAADIARLPVVKEYERAEHTRFEPSNNHQVRRLVQTYLGLDVEKVDKGQLNGRAAKDPFVLALLKYRGVTKILSTYVLPVRVGSPHLYGGLMHPVISVNRTKTWRSSSEDPNAQNWPKRENKHIRAQVDPEGDYRVVSFDYAQIQARNIAMESRDKRLIKYMWDRYDIHGDWVKRCAELVPTWHGGLKLLLSDKKAFGSARSKTKNAMVFPAFFGAGGRRVAKEMGVEEDIGYQMVEELFEQFPDIKAWQERLIDSYYRDGYVTGLSGWRRHAPMTYNEVINAPIQGDEALIVMDAMNRLSELGKPRFQANLEVHDDLTFIWHVDEIVDNAHVVVDHMLDVPFEWAHTVPIGVEMSVGRNWAEQTEVGDFWSDLWKGDLGAGVLAKLEAAA